MQFLEESPLLLRNWPIIIQGMVYILYLESIGHICYAFHLSSMHNSDNPMEYRHHTVSNKVHFKFMVCRGKYILGIFRFPPLCCWRLGLHKRAKSVVFKAIRKGKLCVLIHCSQLTDWLTWEAMTRQYHVFRQI